MSDDWKERLKAAAGRGLSDLKAELAAQAGETAETVEQGSVHEHAVSRSEMRPNNTTIGDHR